MKFYDLNNNNAFLFESKNDNFDIYECVKKGKKYYSICSIDLNNPNRDGRGQPKCGVREIELDFENDFTYQNNNITCPVCGYKDHDSFEINDHDDEYQCENCGALLRVQREHVYSAYLEKLPKIKKIINFKEKK